MRALRIRGAFAGTTLALALTACGATGPDTAQPPEHGHADVSPSPGGSRGGGNEGKITPGGIAVIVLEHLGENAVRQFVSYEQEPGSVSVMIRLRKSTRAENFVVQVYSPKEARQVGQAGKCPPKRQGSRWGDAQCRVMDNGTTVMTTEVPEGFSDDNVDGMVVFGTAISPENGAAMAMYESYDDSPAVSAEELEDMLTDPRLAWLTDPAVNEAGEDVNVKELTG